MATTEQVTVQGRGGPSLRAQRGNLVRLGESFERRFQREDEIATAQTPRNDNNLNSYKSAFAHAYPVSQLVIASAPTFPTCHCERSVAISLLEQSSLNAARLPRRCAPRNDKVGTHETLGAHAYPLSQPVIASVAWQSRCWSSRRSIQRDCHVATLLAMTKWVRMRVRSMLTLWNRGGSIRY